MTFSSMIQKLSTCFFAPVFVVVVSACPTTLTDGGSGGDDAGSDGGRDAGDDGTPLEVLWDEWGVPHIYGDSEEDVYFAFGRAQMKAHGNLMLTLYAAARGTSARFLGGGHRDNDEIVHAFETAKIGDAHYDVEEPTFRALLDAFVAGANDYADAHLDELNPALHGVLPVVGQDVTRHEARLMLLFVNAAAPNGCAEIIPGLDLFNQAGSNGWAIGPTRTSSGNAMLMANPHLGWTGAQTFMEAHLVVDGGVNLTGAALVGLPVVSIGFTDDVAWTHTINTLDACDTYALDVDAAGYLHNGVRVPFETETVNIDVMGFDGTVVATSETIRRSVHGPVYGIDETSYGVRIGPAALPASGTLRTWWKMSHASDVSELEAAVDDNRLPLFTVLAADTSGNIVTRFAGRVPNKGTGDATFWANPVDGNDASLVWSTLHDPSELPRVFNPSSGFVQNANSAPWFATTPTVDAALYPPWIAPRGPATLREQRSLALVGALANATIDDVTVAKHDTRSEMADRVLDDLVAAAITGSPSAQIGAEILLGWDRRYDASSVGAVLFGYWSSTMIEDEASDIYAADPFAVVFDAPFDWATPFAVDAPGTPFGLGDPTYGALILGAVVDELGGVDPFGFADASLGNVARFVVGENNFPANGGPDAEGVTRVMEYAAVGETFIVTGGDTFIVVVEMGTPVTARVLLTYGNSSQPGSPHRGDQLALAAEQKLREAWRTRDDVEAHVVLRETLAR